MISVVTTNVFLNLKTKPRIPYPALAIALWILGTIIYLRPVIHSPVFYGIIMAAAALFALFLLFRFQGLDHQFISIFYPNKTMRNLGNQAAIWFFGAAGMAGLVFFTPGNINETSDMTGFLWETLVLTAVGAIFFFFPRTYSMSDRIKLPTYAENLNSTIEEKISMFLCIGVFISFCILFWFKWRGF